MANKKSKEAYELKKQERLRKQKEERFEKASKKIVIFSIIALVGMGIILLLYFVDWACIYNTSISGKEVSISGFNCLFSGITGTYSSSDFIYGDMAIPFYYYAKSYCVNLSILTLISVIIFICLLASQIITICTKKYFLNIISLALSSILAIIFIACFSVALDMNNSKILPMYCSSNPACSIDSYIIFPMIFTFIVAVIHGIATYKYFSLKKSIK